MQAAHLGVQIFETSRQPGELALALIGARRHVDRCGQRRFELLKAASIAAGLGQIVQTALGVLDLIARREVDRGVERHVDHILADLDELTPDREVVNGAPIIDGVDDRGRFGGQAGEILRECQPGDVHIGR